MRRLLALIPLVLTAAAWPVAAPGVLPQTTQLAADADLRWVPFVLTPGNQIRFAMTVDDRPVAAILDTGVSYSVMTRDYAQRMHRHVAYRGDAAAIGGAVPIGWVATRSLALGGLVRSGGQIAVAVVPAMSTGGDAPVDLLIGPDLLAGYALDIDYPHRRFRLLPSGRLPFRGLTAPLAQAPDTNVYESALTLGGQTIRPVVVDTGDGSTVTVATDAWAAAEPSPPPETTAIAYGLGGPVVARLAIVPSIGIGERVAGQTEVRIEDADGFLRRIGAAGRIGTGFLGRYRVLLDPAAGHMVLAPGPDADAAPLRSTSGLLLALNGDRLKVLHVMRGGPAAAAGWHDGDLICRIDGHPIAADYLDSALANWSVGTPGRSVMLGMCDGTERVLRLRGFY